MAEQPALPTVKQWLRDHPDQATPNCPSCGRPLGIRLAVFNVSGIDLWSCDEGLCNDHGR